MTLEGILPPTGDVSDTAGVIDSGILGDEAFPQPDTSALLANASPVPDQEAVVVGQTDGGGTLVEGDVYRYRFAHADAGGTESTVLGRIGDYGAGRERASRQCHCTEQSSKFGRRISVA